MTLIAAALTPHLVVQASDRRLTKPDGSILDDQTTKSICVSCADAHFTIGYTGLAVIRTKESLAAQAEHDAHIARIRRHDTINPTRIDMTRTDMWMVNFLDNINAGSLTRYAITEELKRHATAQLSALRFPSPLPQWVRGLTFLIAGFEANRPFYMIVSNTIDDKGSISGVGDSFNSARWGLVDGPSPKKAMIVFVGALGAVEDTIGRRLSSLSKKLYHRDERDVAKALVSLVRGTTRHPQLGKLIGKDCLSAAVTPSGQFHATYHPELSSPFIYAPHYVAPGLTVSGITEYRPEPGGQLEDAPWLKKGAKR